MLVNSIGGGTMANNANLRKDFTKEELSENGRKGGLASAKSKKEKKTFKQLMELWGEAPATEETRKQLLKAGFDADNLQQKNVLLLHLLEQSKKGSTKATEALISYLEESKEQKLEIKKLKEEIKKLELEQEKLKLQAGLNNDIEDLQPLAELLKLTSEDLQETEN